MATFTVDGRKAQQVWDRKVRRMKYAAPFATEAAARYLHRKMQAASPVLSGLLRDAIVVERSRGSIGGWLVKIKFSRFPRFFYAILFLPLFLKVAKRHNREMIRRGKRRFETLVNSLGD